MTIKVRHLYALRGGVLSYRNASHHVIDPRDLDADGNPPPFMRVPIPLELTADEVEFDHQPTEDELIAAFPGYTPQKPPG